jgi:hypothetical protein
MLFWRVRNIAFRWALSICSDSRTALLALKSYAVSSRVVLHCKNLQELAFSNRVRPVWVPGHCGIRGNDPGLTEYLLRLPRSKLRILVGLIIGHCPLNKHLHNMGLIDEPICIACRMEDASIRTGKWQIHCASLIRSF